MDNGLQRKSLAFKPIGLLNQLGFGIYRSKENIATVDVALNLFQSQVCQFLTKLRHNDLILTTNIDTSHQQSIARHLIPIYLRNFPQS